jgi:two-component system, OmpR family, sensor kinase
VSLRLRLALWYGSLTTLVVALVCGYSYAIHSRTHYDELDRVLHGVTAHVGEELAAATSQRDNVLEASRLLGAGIRILDRDGQVREQSRNAASAPAIDVPRMFTSPYARPYPAIAALAPALHIPEDAPGRFGLLTDTHRNRFRVYIEPLQDGSGYLAATIPLSHIDDAVAGFGHLMLAMALAGGLVAFGAGWFVARRALHPVTTLTNAAVAIAESRQFSQRVAAGPGRDELGRLAHTFNAMLASLQDAYESQVRFVSAASHELCAPLTVIQANLDLLSAARMPEEERETAIGEASTEANRMARLVADLLVLARADAGVPIRREAVELDRIVLEVLGEARHLTRGQRLEVTDVEPSVVRGDRDRLKQLFLNLIDNAINYTPPTGHIGVAITHHGREALVVIRDTGVGISSDDLPRVFERFFRADPARSRDPGGSGLGLTIAQWIVAEHGGTMELSSRLAEGTTVTIRLPAEA